MVLEEYRFKNSHPNNGDSKELIFFWIIQRFGRKDLTLLSNVQSLAFLLPRLIQSSRSKTLVNKLVSKLLLPVFSCWTNTVATNYRLRVTRLMKAIRWILLKTQRTSFPEEILALTRRKPPSLNSWKSSLSPFLDRQGLLRSRRRLSKAKYLLAARYPNYLDSNHPAVKLFLLLTKAIPMLASNSLIALFNSSFGFCVVGLPSRPSYIIVFFAEG